MSSKVIEALPMVDMYAYKLTILIKNILKELH